MHATLRKALFVFFAAALLISAGCRKKPTRDPRETVIGQQGDVAGLNMGGVGGFGAGFNDQAPGTGLEPRNGVLEDEFTIRGLLQPVFFGFDQSAIGAAERPKLDAAKAYLDANPQFRLLVEGRCDWRGTTEYNLGLGDRRAASVKQYLITLGVADSRIDTLSKGDLEATENASEEAMANDRRADLVILKK